ncbi:hypothetical protein B0H19DRAFT_713101 [Mycena capillaripes]|nr:hypothetical protein B0H19DRAFT_713101 [Mycena capillaripes]
MRGRSLRPLHQRGSHPTSTTRRRPSAAHAWSAPLSGSSTAFRYRPLSVTSVCNSAPPVVALRSPLRAALAAARLLQPSAPPHAVQHMRPSTRCRRALRLPALLTQTHPSPHPSLPTYHHQCRCVPSAPTSRTLCVALVRSPLPYLMRPMVRVCSVRMRRSPHPLQRPGPARRDSKDTRRCSNGLSATFFLIMSQFVDSLSNFNAFLTCLLSFPLHQRVHFAFSNNIHTQRMYTIFTYTSPYMSQ